jgi:hypothetical protein
MGIIGAALTGFAQGAATGYVQNIEAEIEALKQETILERREAMRVRGRQSDADFETKQRSVQGTKQYDEAQAADRKKTADELAIRGAQNKETAGLIQSGQDHAQLANGDHLVVGDDKKVRRTDKDGNLLDGKGLDAKTYGMTEREISLDKKTNAEADLKLAQAKKALSAIGKDDARKTELQDAIRYAMHYKGLLAEKPDDATAKARYSEAMANVAALTGKMPEDPVETVKVTTKKDDAGNVMEVNEERTDKRRQTGGGNPPDGTKLYTVKTQADVAALPKGAMFVGPDGVRRRKP